VSTRLNPYLHFRGTARDAMGFYRSVFGGELSLMTFGQYGMEGQQADWIMHAQLTTAAGDVLMGSDIPDGMDFAEGSWTVSLSGDEGEVLRGWWEALGEGATIETELKPQMWGDEFGQLKDRYGITWIVNISAPQG
jgi:PhnB protein